HLSCACRRKQTIVGSAGAEGAVMFDWVARSIAGFAVVAAAAITPGASFAENVADVLPQPAPPFKGKIAVNAKDSVPDWPKPLTAPAGEPNVLLILLDDVGFADTNTFG